MKKIHEVSYKKIFCFILVCIFSAGFFVSCNSNLANPTMSSLQETVLISEAMNSNCSILPDSEGLFYDWIEIYNPGSKTVSLKGYSLSDNDKKPRKWNFPEQAKIDPGQYLIVFCSGESKIKGNEIHSSFKISGNGETVQLTNPSGKILSRIKIPKLPDDVSCGFTESDVEKQVYFSTPTPAAKNSDIFADSPDKLVFDTFSLNINEYTTNNQFNFYDEDGDCPSWVEIYNYGEKPVHLGGLYLSDSIEKLDKWKFPSGILQPGEYQLVLLSGKKKSYDVGKELHADFKLGNEDTTLILSDQRLRVIDSVELVHLEGNVSYGRNIENSEQWSYYARPTPGKINNTTAFENLAAGTALPVRQVWINEVLCVSGREDVCSYSEDWIELYNGSNHAVDLTGYYLSDSSKELKKYQFSNQILQPGEYLVLSANGQAPSIENPNQLPFRLSNTGETLYLLRDDETLCDQFTTGRQKNGISSGREKNSNRDTRVFFSQPTMGTANSRGFVGYTAIPEFSVEDIYLKNGDTVSLSASDNSEIRYTTDGTDPVCTSTLYNGPISITGDTTIRAATFAEGYLSGGTATHTYLTSEHHQIAVACISTDPDNLFDYERGIYADGPGKGSSPYPYLGANYWKNWERPIHFEFYENNGTLGISFDAGIKIFGQYSRAAPQKSMSVHLREAYGQSEIHYPFFQDNDVTEYHDLLLRSSGQDWNLSKLRDGFFHSVVKNQMDIDLMDYRPVAVYINGNYWGLYNLREKINEDYLATHHGIDPDEVDIIKGNAILQAGNMTAYEQMLKYVRTHDLSVPENYQYICSIVDIDEVINYWITETFFTNTDTGNIKYCKPHAEDGKWRLLLFDLDWGLFPTTYRWNMIEQALDPEGHGVGNVFHSDLLCGLMKNPEFKQKFLKTYAYHLNTTFAPERTSSILHQMANNIESEISRQYERWGAPSPNTWKKQIEFLERATKERVDLTKKDIQEQFHLSNQEMKQLFSSTETP